MNSNIQLLKEVLTNHIQLATSGWSMGSFGVIAEFHQDADESLLSDKPADCLRATNRGAIHIEQFDDIQPVAYEILSKNENRWQHGLALCLPEEKAKMGQRNCLADLGLDEKAVLEDHKGWRLFDMGINALGSGCGQVDFCIRTDNEELINILRDNLGKPIFESGIMPEILKAHPHRIAITPIGRVEVFQKIGGPDTGDKSPEGPHTHLLPKLIQSGNSHNANIAIPDGLIPCAYLHPESPMVDNLGADKPFDRGAYDAFQKLLDMWGTEPYMATKTTVFDQLKNGLEPEDPKLYKSRVQRMAHRMAVRQALFL